MTRPEELREKQNLPRSKGQAGKLNRRCPLFGGFCDQGVLIGECPNRKHCVNLAATSFASPTIESGSSPGGSDTTSNVTNAT